MGNPPKPIEECSDQELAKLTWAVGMYAPALATKSRAEKIGAIRMPRAKPYSARTLDMEVSKHINGLVSTCSRLSLLSAHVTVAIEARSLAELVSKSCECRVCDCALSFLLASGPN